MCVLRGSAQYREAMADLSEANEFLRTVHGDELASYDGDSVRHIVNILRASRPDLYPSALSADNDVFAYNATPLRNLLKNIMYALNLLIYQSVDILRRSHCSVRRSLFC